MSVDVERRPRGHWRSRALLALLLVLLVSAGGFLVVTRISIEGTWHGLFLLRSRDGRRLELKDDLFLGDGSRILAGGSFAGVKRWLRLDGPSLSDDTPHLTLEWNEREGRGFVHNVLGPGEALLTSFGRYEDSDGKHPQGLFVGGSLPDVAANASGQDESGMSYNDGKSWYHIWCNVNEGMQDDAAARMTFPGDWRFLGSRVLLNDPTRVVLASRHELSFTGGRLLMERFAHFTAGEPFFRLGVRVTALGPGPVEFSYVYGDEPWVGHFGSSDGNVGWVAEGLLYYEGPIDPLIHRWAGILDELTGFAAYIEWVGEEIPSLAYVSNKPASFALPPLQIPLHSNEVFIGLEWTHRRLQPGESRSFYLIIGMAEADPRTKRPLRPAAAAKAWPR
jgi:hypothetical protein